MDGFKSAFASGEPGKGENVSAPRRILADARDSELLSKGNAYAIGASNDNSPTQCLGMLPGGEHERNRHGPGVDKHRWGRLGKRV